MWSCNISQHKIPLCAGLWNKNRCLFFHRHSPLSQSALLDKTVQRSRWSSFPAIQPGAKFQQHTISSTLPMLGWPSFDLKLVSTWSSSTRKNFRLQTEEDVGVLLVFKFRFHPFRQLTPTNCCETEDFFVGHPWFGWVSNYLCWPGGQFKEPAVCNPPTPFK